MSRDGGSRGVFDQENVDRFVKRGLYRFRHVPAWESWFERRGSVHRSDGAREVLRAEFFASLSHYPEGERVNSAEVAGRYQSYSATAQKNALWLLEHDPRLWSSPEEFEIPGGRLLRDPPPEMDDDWFGALHDLAGALQIGWPSDKLLKWAVASRHETRTGRARESSDYSMALCRQGEQTRDILTLAPLLEKIFGDRLVRLGPKTWAEFPESLGPRLARGLSGAHCLILEGWEEMKRFPEVTLVRWLLQDEAQWWGWDGGLYRLKLPRSFILPGKPLPNLPYVNIEVGERLLAAGTGGW